ncbi:glycosyltransferase family 2 protein [Candidatus Gracilibacteria bacterium]|nr:glycosyltransferase family 2 protein [Candidatus Gracilibacteria bacterium]
MLISLVICTYNRADILKITLPSYLTLIIPKDVSVELIIVNNNSTDSTKDLVKDFINKNQSKLMMKYCFEPRQGVSFARNFGYEQGHGDYIAYLDDECILPVSWLEIAYKIIKSDRPAFLGGAYLGKFMPGTKSNWYKESYGDIWLLAHNLPNGATAAGNISEGNMFVRRDVFNKNGLFDTSLGMNGETIAYGEGPEFQQRFINNYPNEVIYYHSDLFVWHLIRDEKITIIGRFKDALVRGISQAELSTKKPSRKLLYKSPFLVIYYSTRCFFSALAKLPKSFFSNEHYFTLLHQDYENNNWAEIGRAWYRSKLLFKPNKKAQIKTCQDISSLQEIGSMTFGLLLHPFIKQNQREKLKTNPAAFFHDSKNTFTRMIGKLLRII